MILKSSTESSISSWYQISGIVNEHNESPKVNWDVKTPATILSQKFGIKKIRELHKGNTWIDIIIVVLSLSLFISSWYILATIDFSILWVFIAFIQSIIVSIMFYGIRHDLFMHRQFGGPKRSFILGILISLPQLNPYFMFLRHEDHHLHIGYDLYEEKLTELDKVWKRWLCLTFIGLLFLQVGALRSKNIPQVNQTWKEPLILKKAKRIEYCFHLIWILGLSFSAYFWPSIILKGYLIPFIIFTPFIYSFKYACQHSETDINNSFHCSAYFRTTSFLRIFFYYSIGDSHLIHHIFPRIPSWKLGKASNLFRSEILLQNIPERSLGDILIGYYFKGNSYRARWD